MQMPLLVLALWSLIPLAAVFGVWSGRPWLVTLALVVELVSIISFGVGPYYVLSSWCRSRSPRS
jgi:hypothetical protein